MKRALTLAAALLFVLLLGYAAWLNPDRVDVRFAPQQTIHAQLGLLIATAFLAGAVFALLGVSLRHLQRSAAHWRVRRRERERARIAEWEAAGSARTWDGDLSNARALLKKAWHRSPGNPGAAVALGQSYIETGECDGARRVLEEAVARDPHDPDLRCALGDAVRCAGDTAEAIRIFESVRVQHPRAPRPLVALRELYRRAGRWPEAAHVQHAYLRLLPERGRARAEEDLLHRLRYQAALSGRPAECAEALSELAQHGSTFLPGLVSLGDALVACGRTDEAITLWERSFRDLPRTVLIERLLAHQTTPRDRQRVLSLLQKPRQPLDPDSVHLITARAALEDGDMARAVTEVEALVHRERPPALWVRAAIHARRQEFEQAWTAISRVADSGIAPYTGYQCTQCGRVAEFWTGYCPTCDCWDSYRSVTELQPAPPA